MKTLKLLCAFMTLLVLLLLAVGCSTAAQPAPQLPLGMYQNPLMKKGLEFLDGGKCNFYTFGTIENQGTCTVTQDQVVFTETQGNVVCTLSGTYKWAFDGKALTLTVVQDGCALRKDTLTQGSWVKQP